MLLKRLRSLAGDSLVYGLSSIFTRFLSIWLTPIFTRILTPEDYGAMSLVTTSIALIQSFATLALDQAAIRWFVDATDETTQRKPFATWAWTHLATASVAAAALLFGSAQVSRLITGDGSLAPWFRLVALTLPISVCSSVAMTWLRMQRRPWATVWFATGTTVLQLGAWFVLVVLLRRGLWGIYVGQLIASVAGLLIALKLAGRSMRPRYFDPTLLRSMLRYCAPLVPAAVAVWLVGSVDRYFVQRYVSTAEVGIFSIGSSIASLLTLATWAFQQAWGPFALSIHQAPDARRTYASIFLAYCAGGAVAVAGLALFAPLAIRLLATATYDRASLVVGTLSMSYILMGLGTIVSIGFIISKASRPTAAAVGIAAAATVLLNIVLVPRFGMIGSAVATLCGQAVQPILLLSRANRAYHVPYPFGRGGAFLLWAMVLVVLGETVLPSALTAIGIVVRILALATLPALAMALGVLRWSDVRSLPARLRNA
jgi:O-antigen/teichoic acid export membrane protein